MTYLIHIGMENKFVIIKINNDFTNRLYMYDSIGDSVIMKYFRETGLDTNSRLHSFDLMNSRFHLHEFIIPFSSI